MLPWNSDLETGHALIDAEHREYFRQLDELEAAIERGVGQEQMTQLIVTLQKYVLGHFSREEAHMSRVGCRAHGANCAAHREFARKFEGWIELLTLGNAPLSLVADIQRESAAWILAHITSIDCKLRDCPPAPST